MNKAEYLKRHNKKKAKKKIRKEIKEARKQKNKRKKIKRAKIEETRKVRKQERKKNDQMAWLTPELNKKLRRLANQMTKEASDYKSTLPIHDRFYCSKCKRLYCINTDCKVLYCNECLFGVKPEKQTKGCEWGGCPKEVQGIRNCC